MVSLRENGGAVPLFQDIDARVIRAPFGRYVPLGWVSEFERELSGAIHDDPPDIVHDHGVWLPTNHSSASVARRIGAKFASSPRGMLEDWSLGVGRWRKKMAWWAYQRKDLASASLLHATSKQEGAKFRKLGLSGPLAVVPNGVEIPAALPEGTRASGRLKTALFLSRIHPKKGLIDLVEAWARLRPQGWRVILAGPNEMGHREEIARLIRLRGVEKDFEFPGPIPDEEKWRAYAGADLFILPSYSENFGLVIGEAMAAGLPVITTRGTPWEELETRRCGWWVQTGAESIGSALADALSRAPAELQEMGRRGRNLIQEKYTWEAAAAKMFAAYEWILRGGTPPDCLSLK